MRNNNLVWLSRGLHHSPSLAHICKGWRENVYVGLVVGDGELHSPKLTVALPSCFRPLRAMVLNECLSGEGLLVGP